MTRNWKKGMLVWIGVLVLLALSRFNEKYADLVGIEGVLLLLGLVHLLLVWTRKESRSLAEAVRTCLRSWRQFI